MRFGVRFIFLSMGAQQLQRHLLRRRSFPWLAFCTSVKNQLGVFVWVCFWVHDVVPLMTASVPLLLPHSLHCCNSKVHLETRRTDFSLLTLLFQTLPAILLLVPFHITSRTLVSIYKISCWDFDRKCIKPVYQFGENWHVNWLNLPIRVRGMSLHLFRSLILSSVLCSFQRTNPIRFVTFIPKRL